MGMYIRLQWFSQLDEIHQQKDANILKNFRKKSFSIGSAISCEFAFY